MNPPVNQLPLNEMGTLFPLIVENAPIGMLLVDKEGRIAHLNPKAESILGYTQEELLGQTMELLLPERFRAIHVTHRRDYVADAKPRPMGAGRHLYARHKSGREVPVEIGLVPIQTSQGMMVLASILDITAVKEASETNARLAAVVEGSHDAIITLETDGEKIVTWNRGAELLYGYTAAEMVGKDVSPLIPADRRDEFHAIRDRMHRGEPVQQLETLRLRKDGQPLNVLVSISPLFGEEGQISGVATITHDITEKRQLEQDLLHVIEMEQKRIGQDLHDSLGQQLLAISFLCNVLKKKIAAGTPTDPSEAGNIEDLVGEAKNNVRKLSRGLYAADLESRGLGACLKDMTEHIQETSTIPCSFEGDAALRIADKPLSENLYRLAQEAVNNAVKHSMAKRIIVSLHRKGTDLTLSVRDTGVGFQEAAALHKGIGLRSMRYRANAIGGTFENTSHPEGGTLVRCSVTIR